VKRKLLVASVVVFGLVLGGSSSAKAAGKGRKASSRSARESSGHSSSPDSGSGSRSAATGARSSGSVEELGTILLGPSDGGGAKSPGSGTEPGALCRAADRHTGRPYVWGASGLKSFDCSGYVWRTLMDNGLLIKRTTARKMYLSLAAVPDSERYEADTFVFFDNLKHIGIVQSDSTFYHAQSSKGTNLSKFDPYWRNKVYGFRRLKR